MMTNLLRFFISVFFLIVILATTCRDEPCIGLDGPYIDARLNGNSYNYIGLLGKYGFRNNYDSIIPIQEFGMSVQLVYSDQPNVENVDCFNKNLLDTFTSIQIFDNVPFDNSTPANTNIAEKFEILDVDYGLGYSIDDYLKKYQFLSRKGWARNVNFKLKSTPRIDTPHRFTVAMKSRTLNIESVSTYVRLK